MKKETGKSNLCGEQILVIAIKSILADKATEFERAKRHYIRAKIYRRLCGKQKDLFPLHI